MFSKICEEQSGFRSGYCTIDNAFILHGIIQKALSKKRHSCYCLFVDFKKAFDLIDRNLLFKRLSVIGVKGKLFNSLLAMYSNFEMCVSNGDSVSGYFKSNKGVRQGCILSPIIFSLYINKLAEMINENNEGIQLMPHQTIISILLYADDVVLISQSIGGLQKQIRTLERFCDISGMKMNLSKTKVMLFKNGGELSKTEKWSFKGRKLECVPNYKYLGLLLSSRNKFSKAIDNLALQARRTSSFVNASLRKIGNVPFSVYAKVFDSEIFPT